MLKILVWTIPLGSLWSVLWRVLSARGEHGAALESQIVTLLFRLAAGYVAIRSFASLGAAITTTASMLVLDLLLVYRVRRDGSDFTFFRLAARSALAALGMGVVTLLLRGHLQLWALACVSTVAYAAMIVLVKAFSKEDFALFRTLWHARAT